MPPCAPLCAAAARSWRVFVLRRQAAELPELAKHSPLCIAASLITDRGFNVVARGLLAVFASAVLGALRADRGVLPTS
jgi:hypothetical protein